MTIRNYQNRTLSFTYSS